MSVQANPGFNPYQAPSAALAVDASFSESWALASRGSRLGAALLDGLVVGIPVGVFAGIGAAMGKDGELVMLGGVGLTVLFFFIYNAMLFSRSNQTIGKKWLGIRVRRTDGSHCSLGRGIFLRNGVMGLLGLIPILGSIVGLVDPLMIFREDRRTLHDLIADTIVTDA